MNIKAALEAKLGTLTDEQIEFAIEQFERNADNISLNRGFGTSRRMTTAEYLNELAMNIDFYNRHREGNLMNVTYLCKPCQVLTVHEDRALIQYESGKQPKWVDKELVKFEKDEELENMSERRKFVFYEITRNDGDLEKAYAVCKESHKFKMEMI
jgi:hypothetical protein